MGLVRYLSHPQVLIDPAKPVERWSLNDTGRGRVQALAGSDALRGTGAVFSSAETKALETASPLAQALGLAVIVRPAMHENDRSATGFLPPAEFEAVADRFFAEPGTSVRGWETAMAAQRRICAELEACLALAPDGDVLIVGHGAVGTLLYCALAGLPISRRHDQPAGGGNWFAFRPGSPPPAPWAPMESLI
ncbi:histidine phosphatase family protein [Seohaeicola nanhaiensis]|uniref:Histidine phosphatase family protein n=1 Tax=Seohaeicola nanhaiensis TaxID=1387282 RepID=A0ABV9KAJ9_9RHOB